jgi:hypothetical protein
MGERIYNYNLDIYTKIKSITMTEEDIEKVENKWSFKKVIQLLMFLFVLFGSSFKS